MGEQSTTPPTEPKEHLSDLEIYQGAYVSGQQPSAFTERQKQGALTLNSTGKGMSSEPIPQPSKRDR